MSLLTHADERLCVEVEKPGWYPFESVKSSHLLICLEGNVYGGQRASLLRNLENLDADALDDERLASRLRSCAQAVDGDFVLLWYDRRSGRMGVTGDRFGRLPLYYYQSEDRVVVSRHQGFLLAHLDEPAIDHIALAQLLLLGYPLGPRTLVAGACRLLPQEVLVVSPHSWRLAPPPGSPFRRPAHPELPRTMVDCAQGLRDAFVSACRDRGIDAGSHVLSLSGGIDSRTTGAGMRAVLGPFSAVTFVAPGSAHADERAVASEVARALGADWRAYECGHADPKCIEQIIRMKLGLNAIDVAFGIDYVDRVQSDFPGPVAFWTGEGADKLLCEHRSIPPRPGPDDMVRFILAKNSVWDPDRIAAMTRVRGEDLIGSIRSIVTACDDIEPDDAYVHFLLSQRVVRWHSEGEDRHRISVWPIAPFFGADFFALARAIPPEWKRGRRVYREFLKTLAPDIAALPLADGHAAPGSRRFAFEYAVRERLRNNRYTSALHRRVRGVYGARQSMGAGWRQQLTSLLREDAVRPPFVASEIDRIASGRTPASPHALSLILTAVLAVRLIRDGAK